VTPNRPTDDSPTGDRRTGDRVARFDRLYRSTRTEILAYLVRRTPQREDAADVFGEVYLTAWRRFDADSRELLTLTEWEQLTPAEIAAMAGETPGAVRVRLHRARTKFRVELERLGVANSGNELTKVERAG
jgi:DNA-directed RNA polymerase specialized sigma24 family protein